MTKQKLDADFFVWWLKAVVFVVLPFSVAFISLVFWLAPWLAPIQ